MNIHSVDEVRRTLEGQGSSHSEYLASGMEGHVFRIDGGKVAKVWFAKPIADLHPIQEFYETLQTLRLPFQTPRILDITRIEGVTVSIERELVGTSMRMLLDDEAETIPEFAIVALVTILRSLGSAEVSAPLANIPMMGFTLPNHAVYGCTPMQLLAMAEARIARYGDQLRGSVADFDWIHERLRMHLARLEPEPVRPIHGDLCSENILLDSDRRVSAVLDWGFLSGFGNPAFDVSITAGILNMYGASHRAMDDRLMDVFQQELGHDHERMLLYRALYAILTSNAYSEDGADGHYAWCVGNLQREDIRIVLASDRIR